MTRSEAWEDQAEENVERWGNQAVATLFLALVEEVGEVADVLDRDDIPQASQDEPREAAQGRALIEDMASLGIRTREYLEANFEEPAGAPKPESEREVVREEILPDGVSRPDVVQDEVDDAAPLLFQLSWALDDER